MPEAVVNEETKRNEDLDVELIFAALYNDKISEKDHAAMAHLLDGYTRAVMDSPNVKPFPGLPRFSKSSIEDIISWANQYGNVTVWEIDEADFEPDHWREVKALEHRWAARMGGANDLWVSAKDLASAIVNACVQVLREQADIVFNPDRGDQTLN